MSKACIIILLLLFNPPFVFAITAEQYYNDGNNKLHQGFLIQAVSDYSEAIKN
jgi:hypothetical protein